ncbi:putative RNA recognition motif domain, nucleotide-binding alpha-beta plait domain superfamily [Helianthus debilis subsp. tardiflorus]
MSGQVVKFFVSNIPDGCRPWDLATRLKDFGEVSGTYIARKRDKDGLKFGFVSFKGVRDWKELERRLKGVKLGLNALKINLTRFAKENGFVESARKVGDSSHQELRMGDQEGRKDNLGFDQLNGGYTRPGCSYSMAVKTDKEQCPVTKEISVDAEVSAMGSRQGRAVLVRVRNYSTLISLKKIMAKAGVTEVEFQYVGFGVVAKLPVVTEEDGDLSMGCVGVLVGDGKRIIEKVVLNWQDKRYRVWVSEDLGEWIPDCLDEDSDSVTSDDGDSAWR